MVRVMSRSTPEAAAARTTLSSIAAEANVSMSTVSKVLNGRPGVSSSTRALVEELLAHHGYSPRGDGSSSRTFIEVVFNELDSGWAVELIRGVERIARENKLALLLTVSGDRHTPGPDWIDGVFQRRPVGVVLVLSEVSASHKQQLLTRGIPFVVIDPTGDPAPDVPAIGTTNFQGGVAATRHLIKLGHRRIGVVSGPEDVMSVRARIAGFRSAMDAAGIPVDEELIVPGDYHLPSGVSGGRRLLSLPQRPTAIFAANDLQAFGVMEAARSLGISIPDDLSVVGFDDIAAAQWTGPPLTTVRQPLTQMAEEATRLVISLRDQKRPAQMRVDLATSLVVRGSTTTPAA